ncbi:MAG: M20/M25/M40 family metallo-hydrolase [Kofleriaceae bacterium]
MTRTLAACAALLTACAAPHQPAGHVAEWISDTSSYPGPAALPPPPAPANGPLAPSPIAVAYADIATKIITTARADRGAYAKLAQLTDTIGARLSGSPALTKAIAWAVATMKADGHDVRTEKVMVPHWVRGTEEGALVAPVARSLHLIGLGGTVPTPKGGVTGEVVVVTSWDELEAKKDTLKGKIVLYNVALPPYSEKGPGYGEVAPYRGIGPSRAAKYGAIAVLVRSITAHSLRTPHTGALHYLPDMPKIPAAAVTVEDALLLSRLAATGPVTVKLRLDNKTLPDAESANVIGELRGREKPDEIVVISGHLDSWDVGQGAHDDGAGCVMMMQAITILKQLGLQPRRTIRVVLWTNEENGVRGGKTYAKEHAAELPKHVFAFEADSGGFPPIAFSLEMKKDAKPEHVEKVKARLTEVARLAAPIGVREVKVGHSGADVSQMVDGGVVAGGLYTDWRTYFDYHHTEADTLDKVDPQILADGVAASALLAYVIADMPDRIDAP